MSAMHIYYDTVVGGLITFTVIKTPGVLTSRNGVLRWRHVLGAGGARFYARLTA